MRRCVSVLLCGILIGAGSTVWLDYAVLQDMNSRMSVIEIDMHRVTRGFDMGMRMAADGMPVTPAVVSAGIKVKKVK